MPSSKKEKSLKNKYSSFFNRDIPEPEPELESSGERIYPILGNMDANTLLRINDERDRADQKTKELEGSLGLALQAIKRLEVDIQASKTCKPREEPKKAPIVLMEDNLTKAKKALMTTKAFVPNSSSCACDGS